MQKRWLALTVLGLSCLFSSPSYSFMAREGSLSSFQVTEPIYRMPQVAASGQLAQQGRRLCGQAANSFTMSLPNLAENLINDWGDVQLIELSNGVAYLIGQAYLANDQNQFVEFVLTLSQRTGSYPHGSYAYQNLSGRLYAETNAGVFDVAVRRSGQPFRIGPGASKVHRSFGASGSFAYQNYGKAGRGFLELDLASCDKRPAPPPSKPIQPDNWDVKILSSGGSACPLGTAVAIQDVNDQGDVKLLLPGLQVEGSRIARKFCQVALDVLRPAGWQFAVKNINVSYEAELDQGATANIIGSTYFQASSETEMFATRLQGPLYEQAVIDQSIADEKLSFSDCDGSRALNYKIAVDTRGAWASVDISEQSAINLVWRRCQ